jgi:hypothetical protein
MRTVTADEWADYLSDLRVYQTEYNYGAHSVMYSRLAQGANVGMDVGEVHYCANGDKFYFILN